MVLSENVQNPDVFVICTQYISMYYQETGVTVQRWLFIAFLSFRFYTRELIQP